MKPPVGMLMTEAQWGLYLDLWGKACAAQGWRAGDRRRRMAVHGEVFGREVSAKDIDRTAGFDAIKAKFLELAGSVQGAVEVDHPEIGEARRTVKVIEGLMDCLALYVEDAPAYVREIVRDKFGTALPWRDLRAEGSLREMGRGRVVEVPSELEQLRDTLSARVNPLRLQAGHTVAEMRSMARALVNRRRLEEVPF
jgi:hypothetical protein